MPSLRLASIAPQMRIFPNARALGVEPWKLSAKLAGLPVLGLSCGEKLEGLFETLEQPDMHVDTRAVAAKDGPAALVAGARTALADAASLQRRVDVLRERGRSSVRALREHLAAAN